MTEQKYTVISTSGWHGDHWQYRKQFSSRKVALWYADKIKSSDASSRSYITAVIGDVRADDDVYNFRGDTRRTGLKESHLNNRNCFIADSRPDGDTIEEFPTAEYIENHLTNHDIRKFYAGKLTRNTEWLVGQFGAFQIFGGLNSTEPLTVIC